MRGFGSITCKSISKISKSNYFVNLQNPGLQDRVLNSFKETCTNCINNVRFPTTKNWIWISSFFYSWEKSKILINCVGNMFYYLKKNP